MNSNQKINIFFIGGLTAGPVTPLLAVARTFDKDTYKSHFVDVKNATVFKMVKPGEFPIHTITTGKFRRYWSIKTLLAPLFIFIGLIQSFLLLIRYKPAVVVGAGGYAQVPVIWAAWVLKIPSIIHQQDLETTLSNQLCSLPAKKITVSFEKSLKDFHEGFNLFKVQQDTKLVWIGSPNDIAKNEVSKAQALQEFGLNDKLPVILIFGGGTGATGVNNLVLRSFPELIKIAQVLHSTGTGKDIQLPEDSNYHNFEFINRMAVAYKAADLVVSRAGIGSITELSALRKVAVVTPLPNTHQESNAELLYEREAAVVLDEQNLTSEQFIKVIRDLFFDMDKQKRLSENISKIFPEDSTSKMVKVIEEIING